MKLAELLNKSDKYWRRREDINIINLVDADEELTRELGRVQRSAMEDIQTKIDGFFGKYADETGLTMGGARRRVEKADIDRLARQTKIDIAKKSTSKRAKQEIRLYNLTMKTNRLEYLKAQINLELIDMTDTEEYIMRNKFSDEYMNELKRQSGILGGTIGGTNTRKKLESVVNASFKSSTWSERLWNNTDELRSAVERLLTNSIIQGLNPREIARELRKSFDSSIYDSERLMRTESARIQGAAFNESMAQTGIEQYIFIAQPTGACKICSDLDGKIFSEDDQEIGVNMYPIHPNCRCATALYVDREKWEEEARAEGFFTKEEQEELDKKNGVEPEKEKPIGWDDDLEYGTPEYMERHYREIDNPKLQKERLARDRVKLLELKAQQKLELQAEADEKARQDELDRKEKRKNTKLTKLEEQFIKEGHELEHLEMLHRELEIKEQRRETGLIYTPDGEKVFEKMGTHNQVLLGDAVQQGLLKGNTLTHNHPSSSSFSPPDIQLLLRHQMKEMRAIGKDGTLYRMVPTGSKYDMIRDFNGLQDNIDDIEKSVRPLLQGKLDKGVITSTEANKEHWHMVWTEMEKRTHLKYERISRDD